MSESLPPDGGGALFAVKGEDQASVRVAIEGCAHGTLHAIYASVEEACRVKGWDGIDLLIIGGDFQAVRNQHDLNVTSMPQKYRRMADFHEYYSGARTAPYPTIFIGGNHEASNHLFELYYGGWVAPNIYYLGAANVIRFGPLRIAGLSGIWKGYDYPKPHFERLPYNREETSSIYHVRELDVRKLLSLRSQVDIGLSHDWPQRVEMHGDYQWLFKTKKGFGVDSESGKLGNPAARECLDRLRPPYWFSAHLHTRFAAVVQHDKSDVASPLKSASSSLAQNSPDQHHAKKFKGPHMSPPSSSLASAFGRPQHALHRPEAQRVSAWQQFHANAQRDEAADREKILQEREARRLEEERTGVRAVAQYSFDETFRQVGSGSGLDRRIVATTQSQIKSGDNDDAIPNLDGCFQSRPVKRQRVASDSHSADPSQPASVVGPVYSRGDQLDGAEASLPAAPDVVVDNPDAIDIEMSDEDDVPVANGRTSTTTLQVTPVPVPQGGPAQQGTDRNGLFSVATSEGSEDGGVKLNAPATSLRHDPGMVPLPKPRRQQPEPEPEPAPEPSHSPTPVLPESAQATSTEKRTSTESNLNPFAASFEPPAAPTPSRGDIDMTDISPYPIVTAVPNPAPSTNGSQVSEEMRAQLAALSNTFTKKAKEQIQVSPSLPFPEEISNKTTEFLALGKCEPYQEFLQLMEIRSISSPTIRRSSSDIESENKEKEKEKENDKDIPTRPFKFTYDPEWLAIQRVFASELTLGGLPSDRVPPHRGDTYYRDQIVKEQAWILEHVVDPGQLQVPDNFTITAPVYDPNLKVDPAAMPREVTNPQTSAYCALIGIENKFDISEEERDARVKQGPRPDRPEYLAYESRFSRRGGGGGGGRGRGGGRGGGGGGNYGHGGRGGGGGNRGRGRGGR
ncbi:hypothetical protein A1O1_02503 [Capronia coronata CBS 617.96]|uniref:Lariat debranching enzyme C-terminal domain-containing protein n=1 Tax=Capronia coronata CBS 617.96 TaxID=1182541 RepID=W9YWQ1_9EURO|nr:uncharacterized protein A1O1_02503 [Capronia coronata CBS 617.96]EXJ94110.1 hypothetical protein A1O1_02503 [Capronia coronata CBS 617.96]